MVRTEEKKINKKGFIDLSEINPMAGLLALIAAVVAFAVSSRTDAGIFWTILSTIVAGVVGFLIANKMADG